MVETPNVQSVGFSPERKSELVLFGISEDEFRLAIQGGSCEQTSKQGHIVFDSFLEDGRNLQANGRMVGTEFQVWFFDARVVE